MNFLLLDDDETVVTKSAMKTKVFISDGALAKITDSLSFVV